MADVCPDCGAEAGFVERNARVLQGSCAGCGRTFTIVQEVSADAGAFPPAAPAATPGVSEEGPAAPAPPTAPGPACGVCGSSLALRSMSETSFEARCGSCGTAFTYVLATSPGGFARAPFPARRGPAEEGGPRYGAPRSRPCRECGGPLRFTTDPDGNVTGECTSCGNRFTLPPRREFGGGRGDRGDRRGPARSYSRASRGPGRWSPRREGDRPRPFNSNGPAYRRRERRPEPDDDEDDSRRRRRPRRE